MQFQVGRFEIPPDHVRLVFANISCQFEVYFQAKPLYFKNNLY